MRQDSNKDDCVWVHCAQGLFKSRKEKVQCPIAQYNYSHLVCGTLDLKEFCWHQVMFDGFGNCGILYHSYVVSVLFLNSGFYIMFTWLQLLSDFVAVMWSLVEGNQGLTRFLDHIQDGLATRVLVILKTLHAVVLVFVRAIDSVSVVDACIKQKRRWSINSFAFFFFFRSLLAFS